MGIVDRQNAIDFANAGISICPIVCDGSKKAMVKWTEFQKRIATDREITDWYSKSGPVGTAVICGIVSGGLEVLDFDADSFRVFNRWRKLTDHITCRLPIVETPSDGYHVYYRCETISGNQVIAGQKDGGKPFIETRGQGGYVVTVTSPSEVHPRNYPYVQVAGPVLPEVPMITPEERKYLWKIAEIFDEADIRETEIKKRLHQARAKSKSSTLTPWDDFNSRGDWNHFLEAADWTSADGIHWRHPGAAKGHRHSATLRQSKSDDLVLHVFTSSTPLRPATSHSLFNFVCTILFNGNTSQLTKELRAKGYGN